jgi:hypothetical protein
MRVEISLLVALVTLCSATPAYCEGIPAQKAENSVEEVEVPSMEMIEFLGAWETDDGEWVDPLLLEDIPIPDQESSNE